MNKFHENNINMAVVDDDTHFLKALSDMLKLSLQEKDLDIKLHIYDNVDKFLEDFSSVHFEIVWLDVQLPNALGTNIAKRIFNESRNTVICFISSSREFALSGYGVNALDYILKPLSSHDVNTLLNKCLLRLNSRECIHIPYKGGAVKIFAEEIIYIESNLRQLAFITENGGITAYGKITDYANLLPNYFIQTHKSFLVNMNKIEQFSKFSLIVSGKNIPISRSNAKMVEQAYFKHILGGL